MREGDLIAGRFQLELEVAAGGMGTVYRGRDRQEVVPVAIKVINLQEKDALERFEREATLLSRVSHPGIVKYFDHGTTPQGEHYLVMEWVNGEMLSRRLERTGLTIRESVELMRQVVEALNEVHRFGIIHRDITPRNLMFHSSDTEQIKIVDFGIARQQKAVGLTHTGLAVGSPGYMAPEQVRGEKALDSRADLFAIGCILYQCLTGRPPFLGDPFALALKVLMNHPLPVAEINVDVSPDLSHLVSRMLAKDRENRPRDAAEVAAVLASLRESDSPQRRRSVHLRAGPTTIVTAGRRHPDARGLPHFDFMILVGAQEPSRPPPSDPLATAENPEAALAAAVAQHQGRWERLSDGTIVVRLVLVGEAAEATERAVQCALSIRAAIPHAPMALVGEDADHPDFDRLIERGTSVFACEAMDTLFAGVSEELPQDSVIRLDEATEKLLSPRHPVLRTRTGVFLDARQPL